MPCPAAPVMTYDLPPLLRMQGIIGSGYERMLAKDAFNGEAQDFKGREEEFRMSGYADTTHLHNRSATAPAAPLLLQTLALRHAHLAIFCMPMPCCSCVRWSGTAACAHSPTPGGGHAVMACLCVLYAALVW